MSCVRRPHYVSGNKPRPVKWVQGLAPAGGVGHGAKGFFVLWSAKMCIDAYLKVLLLKMIEEYQLCTADTDVWHDGRFLDRWADSSVLDELKNCFAHYDKEECRAALSATHRLFARLARAVADKRAFAYPEKAEECARAYITRED